MEMMERMEVLWQDKLEVKSFALLGGDNQGWLFYLVLSGVMV